MTNHNDQLKGLLKGILAANPNTDGDDDRQAGRQDVAEYVLAAITLLESGLVTSLGFEAFIEPKPETPAEPEPESYCVQVNGRYWYIAEPSEVGKVQIHDLVDVEGVHRGAHWQGKVTAWLSVDDYIDTESEDLPRLKVRENLSR